MRHMKTMCGNLGKRGFYSFNVDTFVLENVVNTIYSGITPISTCSDESMPNVNSCVHFLFVSPFTALTCRVSLLPRAALESAYLILHCTTTTKEESNALLSPSWLHYCYCEHMDVIYSISSHTAEPSLTSSRQRSYCFLWLSFSTDRAEFSACRSKTHT